MKKVKDLMAKVHKRLDLIMGLGDEWKTKLIDELRAPIIPNYEVGSNHEDIGS